MSQAYLEHNVALSGEQLDHLTLNVAISSTEADLD